MFKKTVLAFACLGFAAFGFAQTKGKTSAVVMPAPADSVKPKKPSLSISDKIKSSKKTEGLFTVYQDTASGSMQLYLKKDQLGKEYIYQSF